MNDQDRMGLRFGLFQELVGRSSIKLGRTALMKLAYLLQTVKGMPLGYDFRLYTYGPFDSDVLHDLGTAEALGLITSEVVLYPSGYGYEFTPGSKESGASASGSLRAHDAQIDWALREFGKESAGILELVTTIIYADQEVASQNGEISPGELCRKVNEIKPHFNEGFVTQQIRKLTEKGLLTATSNAA